MRGRLRLLTDALLQGSRADELYSWFAELVGLPERVDATQLASGIALSPLDAATCMKDSIRTAAYLRGVRDAIGLARQRFPDTRIEVVYAGTGPFAPLAIPLMTLFAPREVAFTLIDIHEASVASVRKLVARFGFESRIVCGDATDYVHEAPIHVAIIEAMQRNLSREPQVAITRHLARQLAPGGVLVPERIRVDFFADDVRLATVMELSLETADQDPDVTVDVTRGRRAILATHITVFGLHEIRPGESGLTTPEVIGALSPLNAGQRIRFRYAMGRSPGLWTAVAPATALT